MHSTNSGDQSCGGRATGDHARGPVDSGLGLAVTGSLALSGGTTGGTTGGLGGGSGSRNGVGHGQGDARASGSAACTEGDGGG